MTVDGNSSQSQIRLRHPALPGKRPIAGRQAVSETVNRPDIFPFHDDFPPYSFFTRNYILP